MSAIGARAGADTKRSLAGGRSTGARVRETGFRLLLLGCLALAVVVLAVLLIDVARDGLGSISMDFITAYPSSVAANAGVRAALLGTIWLMLVVAAFIIPVGVATAIYLEEYADNERWFNRAIEINIQNLAAVPSIVYGILGLAFLVRGPIGQGNVILAGGLTLGLLVLPVVIIAGREAIRAVPPSIREGSMALGATQWQTIWKQVLPAAVPGIATGVILALSRAIGETAPLLIIGAAVSPRFNPSSLFDSFTALPIQIFSWTTDADREFVSAAAGAILVLMLLLVLMNSIAIYLRNRYEQKW